MARSGGEPFHKLDDLPLDVIGQAIAHVTPEKCIAYYEATRPQP